MFLDPVILFTLRIAVMLLFAAAVAHKLWSAADFERTLAGYLQGFRASGRGFEKPILVIVVALEFLVIGLCLLPSTYVAAGFLASGILLVYAFAMAVNLVQKNALLDCGCTWGKSRQMLRPALVVRNIMLAVLALAIALPVNNRELTVVDILSVVVATLTAIVLYTAGNQILSLGFTDRSNNS